MSPDQEHRLEEIFSAARELPPRERATFLDSTCGGDAELRREADSLLAMREQPEVIVAELGPGWPGYVHCLFYRRRKRKGE